MISDKVIQFVAQRAANNPEIKSVLLFGSRARGDHGPKSDYDLAIFAKGLNHQAWSRWVLELEEQAPTLLKLDLVHVDTCTNAELIDAIQREGKLIYER